MRLGRAVAGMVGVVCLLGSVGAQVVSALPAVAASKAKKHHAKAKPKTKKSPPKILASLSGQGTDSSGRFTAPTNWNIEWAYNCSSFAGGTGNFVVYVEQNGGTMAALEDEPINKLGSSGIGTQHYHYGGGGVYLTINSECTWTVKAVAA
jgi:hypothetical protein